VDNLCTNANNIGYIITTGQFYQSYLGLIDAPWPDVVEDAMPVALLSFCGVEENAKNPARHVLTRSFISLGRFPGVAKYFSRVERARLISVICLGSMSKGSWKGDKGHKNSCA
jgi:hypothetical protein